VKRSIKWKTTAKKAIDKNLSTIFKFKWGLPYDTAKRLVTMPFSWFSKEEKKKKETDLVKRLEAKYKTSAKKDDIVKRLEAKYKNK